MDPMPVEDVESALESG